jgi:purine-nucleoside phosphorylase
MINNKDIKFAIILGSGLDSLVDGFSERTLYEEDFEGIHQKRIYTVRFNEKNVLIFCGRKHFYEGYSEDEILKNVRKAKEFGVKYLLITNAAGGLNPNLKESDLMLIRTYIDLTRHLIHQKTRMNIDEDLKSALINSCRELKVKCHQGIYGFLPGPAYETRAEIRMLKKYNIDAVGMSTVPELLEASASGIRVLALSVITNLLKDNSMSPANHKDVLNAARKASPILFSVILRLLNELN